MTTARSINGGETYLSKHLRSNDYYEEGKEVAGEWIGNGAKRLGLEGAVESEHFELVRNNQHPFTGERLTERKNTVAKVSNSRSGRTEERKPIVLHDINISAPKAASIGVINGGDERVVEAWKESVRLAFKEMEHFAAVRLRAGEFKNPKSFALPATW